MSQAKHFQLKKCGFPSFKICSSFTLPFLINIVLFTKVLKPKIRHNPWITVSSSRKYTRKSFWPDFQNISQVSYLLSTFPVAAAAAAAKSLQSCPTLCDPRDSSPPGSPFPGILQARTLEWVAMSFSNAWKWKVKVKSFSRVRLCATPWTAAYQAPPSMGFSRALSLLLS